MNILGGIYFLSPYFPSSGTAPVKTRGHISNGYTFFAFGVWTLF